MLCCTMTCQERESSFLKCLDISRGSCLHKKINVTMYVWWVFRAVANTKMFSPVLTYSVSKSICLDWKYCDSRLFKKLLLGYSFSLIFLLISLLMDVVQTCLETNLKSRKRASRKAGKCMQVTLTHKILFKFTILFYFQVLASITKS